MQQLIPFCHEEKNYIKLCQGNYYITNFVQFCKIYLLNTTKGNYEKLSQKRIISYVW